MNNPQRTNFSPPNERIKYKYRLYLSGAKRQDAKTWHKTLGHLRQHELLRNFAPFAPLRADNIHNYVNALVSGGNYSLSHIDQNLRALREFYDWLAHQDGFKSKIDWNILPYFSLTENQRRTARAPTYKESYEIDEMLCVIRQMPVDSQIRRRNRAMIAIQTLCGLRINELAGILIGNIKYNKDAENWLVYVSPRDMKVKFAKTRNAFFMPWEADIRQIVLDWQSELQGLGFADKCPLFPRITNAFGINEMLAPAQKPEHLGAQTIRNIFAQVFNDAGLPVYRVHSFRHSIVRWAEKNGSPAFFNAVSKSLGHSDIQTTFASYGELTPATIGATMRENPLDSAK